MKKSYVLPARLLVLLAMSLLNFTPCFSQENYKHPHLNASGQVLDSTGVTLGSIKNGIIYNSKWGQVGKFEKQELVDYKGHKLGRIGRDGTFYDDTGAVVFAIETDSKGEKCKVFDPQGKVIATVHESIRTKLARYIVFKRKCQLINGSCRMKTIQNSTNDAEPGAPYSTLKFFTGFFIAALTAW